MEELGRLKNSGTATTNMKIFNHTKFIRFRKRVFATSSHISLLQHYTLQYHPEATSLQYNVNGTEGLASKPR